MQLRNTYAFFAGKKVSILSKITVRFFFFPIPIFLLKSGNL